MAVLGVLGPGADRLEHLTLDLDVVIAKSRVVESAENVVYYFVNGDARVLPSIKDTARRD